MKIVFIADTHGSHRDVVLPEGDVLIHAGDLCNSLGTDLLTQMEQIKDVDKWFGEHDFKKVICIAGNHDNPFFSRDITSLENAVYLQNEHYEYEGIKFFGSPNQPPFYGVFNSCEVVLDTIYEHVDYDVDVLITHGPPQGVLDKPRGGESAGSFSLRCLAERIKPKVHVFGHIHWSYGEEVIDGTTFMNASQAGRSWTLMDHTPLEYEIEVTK